MAQDIIMMFDDAVTEIYRCGFRAASSSIGNLPMFICLFEAVFQLGLIPISTPNWIPFSIGIQYGQFAFGNAIRIYKHI